MPSLCSSHTHLLVLLEISCRHSHSAVHGVAKSWTQLSNWKTTLPFRHAKPGSASGPLHMLFFLSGLRSPWSPCGYPFYFIQFSTQMSPLEQQSLHYHTCHFHSLQSLSPDLFSRALIKTNIWLFFVVVVQLLSDSPHWNITWEQRCCLVHWQISAPYHSV